MNSYDLQPESVMSSWAAYCNNYELRSKSSSGGIFSVIAEYIINNNGVVYGVTMSSDCYSAEFCRVDRKDDLSKLRGSKYIQANIGKTYDKVKEDLLNDILVLFTGTGCQINGLLLFLKKKYTNLICMDVVCHGVPSPLVWEKYIKFMEKKHGGKIINVNFRCKELGWKEFGIKENINDNTLFIPKERDSYMRFFLNDLSLRPSCYECVAKKRKLSDITIGDFWGIWNIDNTMDDNYGTSLILVRTLNGEKIFNAIKENLIIKEVSYFDCVKHNDAEYRPVSRPYKRNEFFTELSIKSIPQITKKFVTPHLYKRILRKIKRLFLHKFGGGYKSTLAWYNYGVLLVFEIKGGRHNYE